MKSKKAIFKFNFDCGRQGELEGVLVSTKEKVDTLVKSEMEVYFGEVLGKHSEVVGPIDEGELIFVSDKEDVVRAVEEYGLTSGYNPFDYEVMSFEYGGEYYEDMNVGDIVEDIIKNKK